MDQEIRTLLARYPSALQPLGPILDLRNAGGLSGARFWKFEARAGPYLLKAWPWDGPSRSHILQVQCWLFETQGLGFVPIPERDRQGHSIQEHDGRCWELLPWMPGCPDLSQPPPRERLRSAAEALATFQQRLAKHVVQARSPGLTARTLEIQQLLEGEFEQFETLLEHASATVERDLARRWLWLARQAAPSTLERVRRSADEPLRLQPCLRDARPEHFLFEGERLSGLIDFGAMGVESVAADLGRLLPEWVGSDPSARAATLDAYEGVRPLTSQELDVLSIFEQTGALLGGARWVRWHFREHRVFEPSSAVREGLARTLGRLERLLTSEAPGVAIGSNWLTTPDR